jgi:transcriptional regulator with XRE-family HTH domain
MRKEAMSGSETLGKRIREEIKGAGYTQAAFAKKMGVTPSRLSNYLNGVRTPDVFTLTDIADILGLSVDALCREVSGPGCAFPKRYTLTVYEGGGVRIVPQE